MRTHGWRGNPPGDDAEARQRIIDALTRCLTRYGPRKTSITDVAEDLGVTRATIYRYYRNIEDLMMAATVIAATEFQIRMAAHVAPLDDPADIIVELFAHALESLTAEQQAGLLAGIGATRNTGFDMLSPSVLTATREFLTVLPIDWPALGYDEAGLTSLAEFFLRLMHSFLGMPDSAGTDPRPFLRRWVVPGLLAPTASHVGAGVE